ncbi:MAG: TolC family protein [Alistipes sp.]|nr:TolC family protein [Alistipes sp.]
MKKIVLLAASLLCAWSVTAQEQEQSGTLVLSLEQAIEIALSESPTIKIADQEVEIKRYAKQGTYASLYPQIDATASYQRVIEKQTMSMDFGGQTNTIKVGSDNSFNGGITAVMPIISAQLWSSLKVSALDVELAVEKARSSRLDMIEQVTQAYYTVLLAKESLSVYKRVYDNAVENNKNIKKRYEVGSVSEFDLISSNVSVQNAEPNVFAAENSVTLTLWQLKALLGLDLNRNIDVSGSLTDYEAAMASAYDMTGLDLQNNSTLKQLDLQEQQLDQAIKITKMANVPTLAINAAYLYTALGNDGKFFRKEAWNPYAYAGLSLNIPIFAGNSRRVSTRQARLNLSSLQLQRENVERQLKVAVIQNLNTMDTSARQYGSSAATVAQAQRGYEIAVKRYEVGSGTLVEVDNSQLGLTQAELSRNQAIYNFLTAKVALDKLLGESGIADYE